MDNDNKHIGSSFEDFLDALEEFPDEPNHVEVPRVTDSQLKEAQKRLGIKPLENAKKTDWLSMVDEGSEDEHSIYCGYVKDET
jgi:hypothetical protein